MTTQPSGGTLDHAAVFGDVAPEDHQTAGLTVRIFDRTDDFVRDAGLAFDVLTDGLAGDGHQAEINEVLLGQFIENCRQTAVSVEVEHMIRACRCQVAQVRDLGAVFIEYMQVDRAARLFRDG